MFSRLRASWPVTALLTIAIGTATALASTFFAAITDLPRVDRPHLMVTIWRRSPFTLRGRAPLTLDDFRSWVAPALSADMPAAMRDGQAVLMLDEPALVAEQRVSENFFRLTARPPVMGRVPTAAELATGTDVAVISGRAWRRLFGSDPAVLGRSVLIDGRPHAIVGVMPDDFWFIFRRAIDVWRPLPIAGQGSATVTVVARPRADERPATLEAALNTASTGSDAAGQASRAAVVQALSDEWTIRLGPGLMALVGPALLILLCACANAANLLLISNARREKEFAVRAALGASPARLMAQSAAETLALVGSAAAGGLVVAYWAQSGLLRLLFAGQGEASIVPAPSPWTLAIAAGAAALVALPSAGLLPALSAARANVMDAFRGTIDRPRFARGTYGLFDLLLVLQVGLAVVLVLMTSMLSGYLRESSRTRPNFDVHAFAAAVHVAGDDAAAILDHVMSSLRRDPAVAAAALAEREPLPAERAATVRVSDEAGERPCMLNVVRVTSGYLAALQLAGVDRRIAHPAPGSVVVSESAADTCWQRRTIEGWQVRVEGEGTTPPRWSSVSAVVADAFDANRTVNRAAQAYVIDHGPSSAAPVLIVRMTPGADARNLRAAIRAAAPAMAIGSIRSVEDALAERRAGPRGAIAFVGVLAALALFIAMTGVGAALHHAVTARRRELGVRLAMGATPASLARTVIARDAPLVVAGEAGGILVTLAGARGYWANLVAVSGQDASVWALVCGVLAGGALLAALAPVVRAARTDPIAALRHE